ncbi:MAG: trehalose-phosphatase, partial [Actinobacteria bacterium]|nr:trehalose-phosphatase [Actinomycetota bacterium]
ASVLAWAEEIAGPTGLRARPAKMSVELHPPIDEDKGTVLRHLAASHTGPVLFTGDDVGDLPALDELAQLERRGRTVLAVAVDSDEAPPELTSRADVLVGGPSEVAELVRSLAS